MQSGYVPTGRASALDIQGGTLTAIYMDRRELLEDRPAAPSGRAP
jgi:hypothetical protein